MVPYAPSPTADAGAPMSKPRPEPSLFVIFGGTGDLARRKLLPALARAAAAEQLGECHVLGVARSDAHDDTSYRALASEALAGAGLDETQRAALCASHLHYQSIGKGTEDDFRALALRLRALEAAHGLPENRTFYLSLPPKAFPATMEGLARAGLDESAGWTRLVIEKPFGRDLATARELNALTHRYFREEQVYRIDHYLGKETVQNLLVFRFANAIFESMWNRERVQSVTITVSESLGLGSRAGYYDGIGALRDMVQNHITQLLTLVAMEPPSSFDAEAIRYEKIKVLKSLGADRSEQRHPRPVRPRRPSMASAVIGYLEEENVPMSLDHRDLRRDAARDRQLALEGRAVLPPHRQAPRRRRAPQICGPVPRRARSACFKSMGAKLDTTDVLVITLQPNEGFALHFDVKVPGDPVPHEAHPAVVRATTRQFDEIPPAYQTLLLNVLHGDQTLFVHADEVEHSWRLFTPLLDNPGIIHRYRAGSWGPREADHLALGERDLWQAHPTG